MSKFKVGERVRIGRYKTYLQNEMDGVYEGGWVVEPEI